MRRKRESDERLDFLANLADDLDEEGRRVGRCPRCQGDLIGRRKPVGQGSTVSVRCQSCDYVFVKRA